MASNIRNDPHWSGQSEARANFKPHLRLTRESLSGSLILREIHSQPESSLCHHGYKQKRDENPSCGFFYRYSGTWPSYLTDLLRPGLVGVVGATINARSSYSQWGPAVTWIYNQVHAVASTALLTIEPFHHPAISLSRYSTIPLSHHPAIPLSHHPAIPPSRYPIMLYHWVIPLSHNALPLSHPAIP